MPQLSSFYGIVIYLYYFDHYPPHFHAEYGEFEIQINIVNLSIHKGYFPSRALSLVLEWATLHQQKLLKEWDKAYRGILPSKIEPLL